MNGKALLVILFAVGIAVAAWFGWRASGDTVTEPVRATAPEAGKSAPSPAPSGDSQQGAIERPKAPASDVVRTEAPTTDAGKTPGAAAAQVTLRGRLVDAAGKPRAGAHLLITSWENPDGIETFGMPIGGRAPSPDGAAHATRTDGTFALPLAADRDGRLDLTDDGLVFANEDPFVQGKKGDQDLGDLVVVRGAALTGIVQDEHGKPVANVKVVASRGALALGTTSASSTDAAGRFEVGMLRPGTWSLRTASAQFLPTTKEFTLKAEERIADLVLVVRPGQAIAGQVVDDLGMPVAGCKVGAKRKEARSGVDIERFTSDEATTTDSNGYFTLSGLAGEFATVRAFGAGHSAAIAANVPIGTGNVLLRVERMATIEGVLLGVDGTPIAGSRVRAEAARPAHGNFVSEEEGPELPFGDGRASATTAADGTFRIDNVQPGAVTVTAEARAHRPARQAGLDVRPAQKITGVRLLADLGATVKATVVDESGKPVAGARVRVEQPREEGPGEGGARMVSRRVVADDENGEAHFSNGDEPLGTAESDASGIATITGLPAGAVVVRAEHAEFAGARPVPLVLQKTGAAEATLAMRIPGFAEVRVTGTDGGPAAGTQFTVMGPIGGRQDERDVTGTTDERGIVRVGPLVAGEYAAELRRAPNATRIGDASFVLPGNEGPGIESTRRRFTVTAGQTATVDLRRPVLTKVFGIVTGADGPVAGCIVELERSGKGELGIPGMGGRSATTGADGSYAIEEVEAGSYALRFGKPEQLVKARVDVEVHADQPELHQDLALRTGKLRVQAWSKAAAEPIANAEVEIVPATDEGGGAAPPRRERRMMMISISTLDSGPGAEESTTMTVGAQKAKTGADGWAEIDDVPAGNWTVRIKHGKHVPVEKKAQPVIERQTTDLGRVEMEQAGRIRGKVLTADGKQVRMALVQSRPVGSETNSEPQPAMGGAFTLDALAPGRHLVRAQEMSMGPGGPGAFGPEVEVEVKAGEIVTTEVRVPAK